MRDVIDGIDDDDPASRAAGGFDDPLEGVEQQLGATRGSRGVLSHVDSAGRAAGRSPGMAVKEAVAALLGRA